ncbi:hypothetical protein CR513_55516, partial [Mucuna pruriens]
MTARTKIDLHARMLSMEFEHLQLEADNTKFPNFAKDIDIINYLGPTMNISPPPSPPLELKSLPGHLKYAYLDNDQQFLILIEEEARLIRQQQRRLNPTILDVVKKEVTKLLAAKIINPISDS